MPSSAAPQHMGNDTLYDIDAVRREWERRETPPGPAKVSRGARTHPPHRRMLDDANPLFSES